VTEGTRTPDLQGHNLTLATDDGRLWATGNRDDLPVVGLPLVLAVGRSRWPSMA